jgi:hypothetical protein
MARSKIHTTIPLDTLADIWDINPILFNGCNGEGLVMYDSTTRPVIWQHNWQKHDQLGRDTIARSLRQAERNFERELGWPIAPTVIVNEEHYHVELWTESGLLSGGHVRNELALKWGMIQAGGVEATSTIALARPIDWDDLDNDGIQETWTLSATTTVTDVNEIAVYFSENDRMTSDLETWRIRPVDIEISGGEVTITGKRWQVIRPSQWEQPSPQAYEGIQYDDNSNFVATVDIRRKYFNTTASHVTFYWCDGSTQTGYFDIVGNHYVMPYAGTYDNTEGEWTETGFTFSSNSDLRKLTVSYLAGIPLENGQVEEEVATVVAQFATGFMPKNMGATIPVEAMFNHWREDMARNAQILPYNADEFRNPLGAWRGAMEAWRYIVRQDRRSA